MPSNSKNSRFQSSFSRILQQNQSLLASGEAESLQLDLRRVLETAKFIKNHRKYAQNGPKSKIKTGTNRQRAPHDPRHGVIIDGIRCCRLCKLPIPHKTKPEWQKHMMAARRRHMQQHAKEYWTRVGYDKLWEMAIRARRARSMVDRVEAFRELAPVAAFNMSDDDIMRLAAAYREPRGWLWSLQMWRVHVRRNYR